MNPRRIFSRLSNRSMAALKAVVLSSVVLLSVVGVVSSTAQTQDEERQVENRLPEHLPIKLKVKNPEKVKDLKNQKWLGEIELEVKNVGTKPIYYILMTLVLPDVKVNGVTVGYRLRYGRSDFVDLFEPVRPEDVPLLPGESYVFKVEEKSVRGFEFGLSKGLIPDAKKTFVHLQMITFGDGTGLAGPDGMSLPNKGRGENRACPEPPRKEAAAAAGNGPPGSRQVPVPGVDLIG